MNMNLQALAHGWRADQNFIGRGGVVIIYNGAIAGWMSDLRDPNKWAPGCIAIDENGMTWTAQDGTERDGAKHWLPNPAALSTQGATFACRT